MDDAGRAVIDRRGQVWKQAAYEADGAFVYLVLATIGDDDVETCHQVLVLEATGDSWRRDIVESAVVMLVERGLRWEATTLLERLT